MVGRPTCCYFYNDDFSSKESVCQMIKTNYKVSFPHSKGGSYGQHSIKRFEGF